MRTPFSSGKGIAIAACSVLILACAIAVIIFENDKHPQAMPISGQQAIDTGLSLQPSSSAAAPLPVPSSSSVVTAPVYNGCELSLDFILTRGNLQSVGSVEYTLVAKDIGATACRSASVSVYYASDENYASSSPAATADGYYWQLGDLVPDSEIDIALVTGRTAPLASGAVTNEACLSADNGADACSNSLTAVAIGVPTSAAARAPAASAASASTPSTLSLLSNEEAGVWEWTSLDDMTPAQMQQVVNEAAANDFNAIYVTVDDYLTATNTSAYDQAVATFLSLAAQKNIAVDAEAGWRDWAEPQNTGNAAKIMDFVAGYNGSHAQKFRGVQYDIEPYLLPQYAPDESGVLTQYAVLVDQLVQQDKANGLPLTIVVPHFYDEDEGWTPEITVDGVQDYTYRQIVRLLNELPMGNGRIIEMAYRNFATGADSAVALSDQEIHDADDTGVKVLIAQETGPVTPSYVTFYGTSRAQLFGQIGAINQAFASDTAFQGIAIDYLDPYLQLQ